VIKISVAESSVPVYAWFDNDSRVLYYYTKAKIIDLNPDSSYMFNLLSNVEEIDLINEVTTSSVSSMESMFNGCKSLKLSNLK
jgi:hypothetical protein